MLRAALVYVVSGKTTKLREVRLMSLRRWVIAALILLASPTMALAQAGLVVKQSAYPVAETVDRLEKALIRKGITVFARIDHAPGTQQIGAELLPTELLVFGNPKLGTPLMQSAREIGLDLPLKALVWEDEEGNVWLAYNDPLYLAERHGVADRDQVFGNMGGALEKFSDVATKAGQ